MITSFLYQKGKPVQASVSRAEMLAALKQKDTLLWVDLEDPSEFESETLIEIFNFHPLAVEDCIVDKSSSKVDDYEDYLFLVTYAFHLTSEEELDSTELNVFVGRNYVVTFHRGRIQGVEQVRNLVQRKADIYMGRGSSMLFHSILDHLVDSFMPLIDRYDKTIDMLEEHVFTNPPDDFLSTVLQAKHDMFNLRRLIAPLRDTVHYLIRNPTPFIHADDLIYYRDIYDHLYRIYGMAESYHESLASILQAYFSHSSNKLNDVMRHMTVLATLAMPIIMVASLYGMNFEHLPGRDWEYGFYVAVGISILFSGAVLVWMKFKKWI